MKFLKKFAYNLINIDLFSSSYHHQFLAKKYKGPKPSRYQTGKPNP